MTDYCTEVELENRMGELFSGSTRPTTTVVAGLITGMSRTVDALAKVTASKFGASPPVSVKQATIEGCVWQIDKLRTPIADRAPISELHELLNMYLKTIEVDKGWGISNNTSSNDYFEA